MFVYLLSPLYLFTISMVSIFYLHFVYLLVAGPARKKIQNTHYLNIIYCFCARRRFEVGPAAATAAAAAALAAAAFCL